MHILLAGGTGFFGRALLKYLQSSFCRHQNISSISILSRNPQLFLEKYPQYAACAWLHIYEGDVLEPRSLQVPTPITHVLHAASDSTLISSLTPLQIYLQIIDGTRNLLDFAVAKGAKRFLYVSSGAVYAPWHDELEGIPEDWYQSQPSCSPANAYGLGKRVAEYLCGLYADSFQLETVVARCFSFVGPDLPLEAHFAIGNFIRDAFWLMRLMLTEMELL